MVIDKEILETILSEHYCDSSLKVKLSKVFKSKILPFSSLLGGKFTIHPKYFALTNFIRANSIILLTMD